MWAPATVIIKILIVLPFTSRRKGILNKRNLIAPVIAMFITVIGYYIADLIIFGKEAAFLISVTSNGIQGLGSAAVFYILSAALEKAGVRRLCS